MHYRKHPGELHAATMPSQQFPYTTLIRANALTVQLLGPPPVVRCVFGQLVEDSHHRIVQGVRSQLTAGQGVQLQTEAAQVLVL